MRAIIETLIALAVATADAEVVEVPILSYIPGSDVVDHSRAPPPPMRLHPPGGLGSPHVRALLRRH